MNDGHRLIAATGLHKGDREYQQDQVMLLTHARATGCMLGVVADGMGGRSGGRKASDQVVLTARQLFERYAPESDDAPSLLKQIAEEAHTVIKLTAISSEQEPHSTIACFLVNPAGDCHWVHVGDSRIYHFRNRRMVKRTIDHSYVQTLVDRGEISEAEANNHPQSNILMGCLGTEDDPTVDTHFISQLVPGDCIVACSDGVWHYFTPDEMASVVSSLPPREASEFLIEQARSRAKGTGDNLSVIVVKVLPLVIEKPKPVGPVISARTDGLLRR